MDTKKYLIVIGSPRKKGNSTILAQQAAEGIASQRGTAELVHLHGMDIKPCHGCDGCRKKPGAPCVIKDDMQSLYKKLIDADGLIISSPVYWFTLSAQTKLFMDRWYALGGNDGGYLLKGKPMALMLTYGDSDPFNSGAVNALRTFQDACRYLEAPVVGTVYGTAHNPGDIACNRDVMEAAFQLGQKMTGI